MGRCLLELNLQTILLMKWLAVLYDDQCGMCSRLRAWLEKQITFVPLRLIPLHAPNLTQLFPGVHSFNPDEKLVVIADDGSVWRGDSAWITLLWALESGRELSLKLATPILRPLARRVVTAVSQNRLKLSRWLHLSADSLPAEESCNDGTCAVPIRKAFPNHQAPPPLPIDWSVMK
jgi:predicted DCC family thiol-disulfide oxidoreductase YuxK